MTKATSVFILILFMLPLIALAQYEVGDYVDNFTLPDANGNLVNLYDYSDRIVVIPFWETG